LATSHLQFCTETLKLGRLEAAAPVRICKIAPSLHVKCG